MKNNIQLENFLPKLYAQSKKFVPVASQLIIDKFGQDPFLILIFCILSLRTKDQVSFLAACRLFAHAKDPQAVAAP